ncbi:hypothetical protein PFLL34_02758 [Pseudomonas fluorescens]|nr:hypothetical protein PFLL34_02758 [Pseudomonas fluorescens]
MLAIARIRHARDKILFAVEIDGFSLRQLQLLTHRLHQHFKARSGHQRLRHFIAGQGLNQLCFFDCKLPLQCFGLTVEHRLGDCTGLEIAQQRIHLFVMGLVLRLEPRAVFVRDVVLPEFPGEHGLKLMHRIIQADHLIVRSIQHRLADVAETNESGLLRLARQVKPLFEAVTIGQPDFHFFQSP